MFEENIRIALLLDPKKELPADRVPQAHKKNGERKQTSGPRNRMSKNQLEEEGGIKKSIFIWPGGGAYSNKPEMKDKERSILRGGDPGQSSGQLFEAKEGG